jgi:hypothetical protein
MNCYECKHRRNLAGSCNSTCAALPVKDQFGAAVVVMMTGGYAGKIQGHPHGVQNGWFNWPLDFDPTWVKGCYYFEKKD